jgi:hypothetical protein
MQYSSMRYSVGAQLYSVLALARWSHGPALDARRSGRPSRILRSTCARRARRACALQRMHCVCSWSVSVCAARGREMGMARAAGSGCAAESIALFCAHGAERTARSRHWAVQRHPMADRPLIDYKTCALLVPCQARTRTHRTAQTVPHLVSTNRSAPTGAARESVHAAMG